MIEVTEAVRGLALATMDNPAVALVLADALEEENEPRMAERCRTGGLKAWELKRLADGTAVTRDKLKALSVSQSEPMRELLPRNWRPDDLEACDLVPDAVLSWFYSGLSEERGPPDPTHRFGDFNGIEIYLYDDGSMQHYTGNDEHGPECHADWKVFATDLVERMRVTTLYTYWSDDPDEEDEPDNVPEAYRGLLSHLFGGPEVACAEIGKLYGEPADDYDDGWPDWETYGIDEYESERAWIIEEGWI